MVIENIKNDIEFQVIGDKIVATRIIVDEYDNDSAVKLIVGEESRINYMYQTLLNSELVWEAQLKALNKDKKLTSEEVSKYRMVFDNQMKILKEKDIVWAEKEEPAYRQLAKELDVSWNIDKAGYVPEDETKL